MPGQPVDLSQGASGNMSNLFSSLVPQVGNAVTSGLERAQQAAQFSDQMFAKYGLFSPIGVIKNKLGNVDPKQIAAWRSYTLDNIHTMPVAVGYALFGEMYPNMLDANLKKTTLRLSRQAAAEEMKFDPKYEAESTKDYRKEAQKAMGWEPGGEMAKKDLKFEAPVGGAALRVAGFLPSVVTGGGLIYPEERRMDKPSTYAKQVTGVTFGDKEIDTIQNDMEVNLNRINELNREIDKVKNDPQKVTPLTQERDDLFGMNSELRSAANAYGQEKFMTAYPEKWDKLHRVIGNFDAMNDYLFAGNQFHEKSFTGANKVFSRYQAFVNKKIMDNFDTYNNKYKSTMAATEAALSATDKFFWGGALGEANISVKRMGTSREETKKKAEALFKKLKLQLNQDGAT